MMPFGVMIFFEIYISPRVLGWSSFYLPKFPSPERFVIVEFTFDLTFQVT